MQLLKQPIIVSDRIIVQTCSMTPLEVIKAFERHLQSEVQMGLSTIQHACANIMPTIVARLRQIKDVQMEHATEANEYLITGNGTFSFDERKELSGIIKASIKSDVVTPTTKAGHTMQTHTHIHRYLPSKIWAVAQSTDTLQNKMRVVATFLCRHIGLVHPDEKTKKLIVVILIICSKLEPSPEQSYTYIRDFGNIYEQKRTSGHYIQTLKNFPKDPADFIKLYPDAFGEDTPVACAIDESAIIERCRKEVTPARSSNAYVKQQSSTCQQIVAARPSPSPQLAMQPDLVNLLQQFMMQAMSNRSPVPELRMQPPVPGCDMPTRQQQLTICDGGLPGPHLAPPSGGQTRIDKLKELTENIMQSAGHDDDSDDGASASPEDQPHAESDDASSSPKPPKNAKVSGPSKSSTDVKKKPACDPTSTTRVSKKPAIPAPTTTTTSRSSKKRRRAPNNDKIKLIENMGNCKPKTVRPKAVLKSIKHFGGSILWAGAQKSYRVFKKTGDKHETLIPVDPSNKADIKFKFAASCSIIECDPRNA